MPTPKWFKDLPTWVQILSIFISVIGIGAAAYAVLHYVVKAEISNFNVDVAQVKSDNSTIKDEIEHLKQGQQQTNTRIDTILSDALSHAFPSPSGRKPAAEEIEKAGKIIEFARKEKMSLDPVAIKNYGLQVAAFTTAPQLSNVAWSGLQQAVDYHSFANEKVAPKLPDLTQATGKEDYSSSLNFSEVQPGEKPLYGVFFAGGHVPEKESARLETLDKPRPHGSTFGFFIVRGGIGTLSLDGMYMKNVIVENATLSYGGGPLRLENVYFVNCRFKLTKTEPVQRFGEAVLEAAATNFDTTSRAGD
jgi:hypothetical protein